MHVVDEEIHNQSRLISFIAIRSSDSQSNGHLQTHFKVMHTHSFIESGHGLLIPELCERAHGNRQQKVDLPSGEPIQARSTMAGQYACLHAR